jgi:hypothetical protein
MGVMQPIRKNVRWPWIFIVFLSYVLIIPRSWAQHYLTLGAGYSAALLGSDDLNLFKDTYNGVFGLSLIQPMKGFDVSVGMRWEIGYRRWSKINMAFYLGSQNFSGTDQARFYAGERQFTLDVKTYFVEFEAGRTIKKFFINGVLLVFFKRDVTLNSVYSTSEEESKKALDGTFKGITAVSTDFGIALGYFKEPICLTAKITYPLFTGGGSRTLQDRSPDKMEEGTYIFPDDYEAYLFGEGYQGVKSNIDGLKFMVTVAYVFKIKK